MFALIKRISDMIDDNFTPIAPLDDFQIKFDWWCAQVIKVMCAIAFVMGLVLVVNVVGNEIVDIVKGR